MLSFSCLSRDLRVVLRAKVIWRHTSEVSSFKSFELGQTLEKFQVLHFFSRSPPKKRARFRLKIWIKIQVTNWKKNPDMQDLKIFYGLKQTLISQDLDFQKSRCRFKDRRLTDPQNGAFNSISLLMPGQSEILSQLLDK
jgi:hypothetical protein